TARDEHAHVWLEAMPGSVQLQLSPPRDDVEDLLAAVEAPLVGAPRFEAQDALLEPPAVGGVEGGTNLGTPLPPRLHLVRVDDRRHSRILGPASRRLSSSGSATSPTRTRPGSRTS